MSRSIEITQKKPENARVSRLEVLRAERVSPSFHRITVGGEMLEHFTPMGFDQWFRLFMPRVGQDEFKLPTRASELWYAQWLLTAPSKRPGCRNYTVREWRPGEIDIDFVVHLSHGGGAPEGIAAPWALDAKPGDALGLLDQGIMYTPADAAARSLIVSDESGLPAVEGILRSLPADAVGRAIVEVPLADDRRELARPAGFEVDWVVRAEQDGHPAPGASALAACAAGDADYAYAFAIGESGLATGVRRHLVGAGMPKDRVRFCGYWKQGSAGR